MDDVYELALLMDIVLMGAGLSSLQMTNLYMRIIFGLLKALHLKA